jgi:pimeloyl-ACP methyl ester carboxylesterase
MTMRDARWVGMRALTGGKAYVNAPLGQLHYRRLRGPRATVILLHQSPFGLAEWVDVQPQLAAQGFDVIASDNPGYGQSDAPAGSVSVAMLADNLLELLDALELQRAVVAGHHSGAAIAAAFAARHPQRTAGVVLHGCPWYTAAEREQRLARPLMSLDPRPDGGHFADLFQAIHRVSGGQADTLLGASWATLGAVAAGHDPAAYRAVFAQDMQPDLMAIAAPTLLLTDTADVLHAKDREIAKLRGDFRYEIFSDLGSFAPMLEPLRWATIVGAFIGSIES